MGHLIRHTRQLLKLVIFLGIASLVACDSQSDESQYAFISASVEGTNTGAPATKTIVNRQGKNHLPPEVTRIEFNITDSQGVNSTAVLNIGPETQTINFRVFANRDLVIRVDVYSGDTLSFQGESPVAALRPGQTFPFSIEADPVGEQPAPIPILNLDQNAVSVFEGDDFVNGFVNRNLTFTVSLSELANGNVTADFTVSDGTASRDNSDYLTVNGTLTIPAGSLSANFDIEVGADRRAELDETLNIVLSNVSANATLGTTTTIGTIIEDDFPGRLNDTGMTLCANEGVANLNNNNLVCADTGSTATTDGLDTAVDMEKDVTVVPAGQDAHFGRDASVNNPADGLDGFNFSKLTQSGDPLQDQTQDYATQQWDCVKDNYTSLVWEVKRIDGNLRDRFNQYTWFNSTGINDGGFAGLADPGNSTFCTDITDSGNCDTEKYIAAVNDIPATTEAPRGLCARNNWRLPTAGELLSIINHGFTKNTDYFPNTPLLDEGLARFWTSASVVEPVLLVEQTPGTDAWTVSRNGDISTGPKNGVQFVRLVADDIFE